MQSKIKTISKGTILYFKKAKLEWILFVALLFADLISKWLVVQFWGDTSYALIENFLYINYTKNQNAAFGSDFGLSKIFGEGGVIVFFVVVTLIVMLGFCFLLYKWKDRRAFARVALVLVLAGGLGNLYDRVALSYVRDFVSIVFFGHDLPLLGTSFAIFNLADSFLTVGIVMFVWYVMFMCDKDKRCYIQKT